MEMRGASSVPPMPAAKMIQSLLLFKLAGRYAKVFCMMPSENVATEFRAVELSL